MIRLELPFISDGTKTFQWWFTADPATTFTVTLDKKSYATQWHLVEAINDQIDNPDVELGQGLLGMLVFSSAVGDIEVSVSDSDLDDWLGGMDGESGSSVYGDTIATGVTFLGDFPIADAKWFLALDRTANFSDAGLVSARLVSRRVGFDFTLHLGLNEDISLFMERLIKGKRLAVWELWVEGDFDGNNACVPLPNTGQGYKFLFLEMSNNELHKQTKGAPMVFGYSRNFRGILYGI